MKFKIMAGTLSIIVMLTTPTLAQAHVVSDKSSILLMGQSKIVGLRAKTGQPKQLATLQAWAKALDIDITSLTNDQARTKIKAVERANTLTHLLAQAKTLGIRVDIGKITF